MKYIAIVDDKGELIAAKQLDEAANPTISPVSKPGQKVVEIDMPMKAAGKEAARMSPEEIVHQLKDQLKSMK